MKNDEGDFCNFELCEILATRIYGFFYILRDSLSTKPMIRVRNMSLNLFL